MRINKNVEFRRKITKKRKNGEFHRKIMKNVEKWGISSKNVERN